MLYASLFHDVRFPSYLARRAVRGAAGAGEVLRSEGGAEVRYAESETARLTFDLSRACRSRAEAEALKLFFEARSGSAYGFRFRDPQRFGASGESLGVGDGESVEFPLFVTLAPAGGGADGSLPVRKRALKPAAGSVTVRVNGSPATGVTSNVAQGTVTFDSPPEAGATVTADFLYDLPVRFAQDTLIPKDKPPYSFADLQLIELLA